jgi:hypothetical protein
MAQEIGRRMAENGEPVSPAPDVSRLSATELGAALRALPYRQSAFLVTRLLRDSPLEASAAVYGISPAAFSVHLLRAALALATAAALPCRPPADDAEEERWARALTGALEHEVAGVPPSLATPVALCRRLRALGPEVVAALESAEREEEGSPRSRREDLLRRLAVLALLGLTAYLYCNRAEAPPEKPVQPRLLQR